MIGAVTIRTLSMFNRFHVVHEFYILLLITLTKDNLQKQIFFLDKIVAEYEKRISVDEPKIVAIRTK